MFSFVLSPLELISTVIHYIQSFEVIFTKYLYIFDAIRYVRQIYMDVNLTKLEIIVLPELLLLHGGSGNVK